MIVRTTILPGVLTLEPSMHHDARGWFMETHSDAGFAAAIGTDLRFVQDNHSMSARGVVRGLHYQIPPFAQGKLVRLLRGRSFHAVVDLRCDSPTFGRHATIELDTVIPRQLWIPEGLAHGLMALEDCTEIAYKVTAPWSKEHERSVRWNDPELGIAWPLPDAALLSAKDAAAPLLRAAVLPTPND